MTGRCVAPQGEKWKNFAACASFRPDENVSFTDKPADAATEAELGRICASCDVFADCFAYHEHLDAIEVWAAGEWRAAPNEQFEE